MNMIDSTKNVPKDLLVSRDYQALLKIMDLITVSKKAYIENMIRFLDPFQCPSKYLPLLASMVGYEYDNKLSYDANRVIIKYYPYLIRNRGTVKGLKLATAISIVASDMTANIASAMEMLSVVYVENADMVKIFIYYPSYINKINDLIEVVRPVGVGCKIIEALSIKGKEEIDVDSRFRVSNELYTIRKRSSISDETKLGHAEINQNGNLEEEYRDNN